MNRKSTGIGKEEQPFPGWGTAATEEERGQNGVCGPVGGANVLELGEVDEARLKTKAA